MALIIKAQMPKGCCWEQESGCFDICKVRKVCGRGVSDKPLMTGYRHRDCPIIGEIPDRHGRIVDLDKVLNWLINEKRVFSMAMSAKVDKALVDAPVIVEATE